MGAQLHLVQPRTEDDIALNRRKISAYIAKLIGEEFDESVFEMFFDPKLALGVELWYWFDDINLVHNLAVIGDNFATEENPDRACAQLRFQLPILLFSIIRLRGNSDPLEAAAHGRIFRVQDWRSVTADEADAIDSEALAYWKPPEVVLQSVQHINIASIKELANDANAAVGEDWTALLVLVTHLKNLPAVPIPKAAEMLQIEEKTVRNRIERKELEAIPRKGTLWVTLRSIRYYLRVRIHSTAQFDVLSDVEKEIRKRL